MNYNPNFLKKFRNKTGLTIQYFWDVAEEHVNRELHEKRSIVEPYKWLIIHDLTFKAVTFKTDNP